jgi:RNA polymerase sigma-54 factor
MLMQQRIGLRLAQKPVLTQSLRQLVKLLALNKLELKEEIALELVANPVLETLADGEGAAEVEGVAEDAWEGERTAEPADREVLEAAGLTSRNGDAPEASAEVAPETDKPTDPFDEIDLGSYFDEYLDPGYRTPLGEITDKPSFETFLSKSVTLTDHLLWQLSLSPVPEKITDAAECIIGNLNEDGYLTSTLEEIGEASEAAAVEVEQALRLVQEFDPLGVAARDLRECLTIQLGAVNAEAGVAGAVLRDFWEQFQRGDLQAICAAMGRPLRHIETAAALIKDLDPRPGQRYNVASARAVEPDVQFVKTQDGFQVVLNEDDMPELRLNRRYRRLLERGRASKDVRNYIKERYNSAIQLLRNIEQRRQTIRSVCDSIVTRQGGFLSHGIEHLRPMMIKEVAEEIGVHPSTVSRAVANKYAHTPHGVYELRFFFSEGVQGPSGSSIPLMLLKRKVKRMIEEEDATQPLTDDQISKILRESGIMVTRRTVAKYREDLGIPSTHRRRRRK